MLYAAGSVSHKIEAIWSHLSEGQAEEVREERFANLFQECFRIAGVEIPLLVELVKIEGKEE